MPVYEYYCESCNGVFEKVRPISEASDPWPCPVCSHEGRRVMPTSFAAFTYREGYPRSIPDRGTYWHFGQEVKHPISGPVRPNEHPEINKPTPPPQRTKGEIAEEAERKRIESDHKKVEETERQAAIQAHDRAEASKPVILAPSTTPKT